MQRYLKRALFHTGLAGAALALALLLAACPVDGGGNGDGNGNGNGGEPIHAAAPAITGHPQNAVYSQHKPAAPLTVTAESPDGGGLSYQWYTHTENKEALNTGGTAIADATGSSYAPPTGATGVFYYYAEVTNAIADNGDGGAKTARKASMAAAVNVNTLVNADTPVITSQPVNATYLADAAQVAALTVGVSLPPGAEGTLSYQWYRNTENTNDTGTAIADAAGASYTPPVNVVGLAYYYVEVANTIADNGDGGNKKAQVKSAPAGITVNADPAKVNFLGISYQQEPAALVLHFDKDVEGLNAGHITAASGNAGHLRWNTTGSVLSGPDAEHRYYLPLQFEFTGQDTIAATATVVKEGITFTPAARTGTVTLINIRSLGIAASPAYSTDTRTEKITFTFDKDIPGLSVDDIYLRKLVNPSPNDVTTAKQGLTHMAAGVYDLAVSGYTSQATGRKSQTVSIVKNGYRFISSGDGNAYLGETSVNVYYEKTAVSSVTLTPSPADTAIPLNNTVWPKTWALSAAVATTGSDTSVTFTVQGGPVAGVTLTQTGNTAALSIAETIQAASVTVRAASVEDPSKYAEKVFIIEKNVGLVQNDAAFEAALAGDATLIAIATAINTPAAVTAMTNNKTIDIRSGGKLTVTDDFTAKGSVIVRSGGTLEIASGKTLTADQNTGTTIKLGNEEIEFPSGTYKSSLAEYSASLAYDGAAKTVIIGGQEGAVLEITPLPAGTGSEFKFIRFPMDYSLRIKQDVMLHTKNNYLLDFGEISEQYGETGIHDGRYRAKNGDALFTATTNGIILRSAASNGYLELYGSIYCAPGKSFIFPAEGSGYYPLTLSCVSIIAATAAVSNQGVIIQAEGGGMKINVLGNSTTSGFLGNSTTFGLNPYTLSAGKTTAFSITRSGTSGTLLITVRSAASTGYSQCYLYGSLDLGGTSSDPVGRIVLKAKTNTQNTNINFVADKELKTGNTPAGEATYTFANSNITKAAEISLKGSNASGSGYFASSSSTAGSKKITNTSATDDVIIDATTVVTGE
jgi:hypothetical protein